MTIDAQPDSGAKLESAADRAAATGDIPGALRLLRQLVVATPQHIDGWMKLAAMQRAAGDIQAALEAIEGALRVDPLHFVALMSRGRLFEAAGRHASAAQAYLAALAQWPEGRDYPAHLRAMIDHAHQVTTIYRSTLGSRWKAAAEDDASALLTKREHDRLRRFVSNSLRETRVFHSEPSHFAYPGLSEREFHDRDEFPWLAGLEAATDVIRGELELLMQERLAVAEPYVQYSADAPVRQWAALNHSMDWTAFHLMKGGERIAGNADRCPRTMEVLKAIPQPTIGQRSPNAMFSLLKPRTHIPPHTGVANTRLVCHLPLIVPPNCWFRVGATRREWQTGEAFVFDDTIEHEAANDSDQPRVVMIIDVWHPDLSTAERAAVTRVMEADESSVEEAGL